MFSKNLQNLLKEKGLSQSELASLLNTHRQNVYQWISGKTTPRSNMLLKVAEILNVSVSDLLEEKQANTKINKPQKSNTRTNSVASNTPAREKLSLKTILSTNIKYYRRQMNLTQAQFAKEVGCDPVYVSYIENCQRFPSLEFIEKMAEVFNIDNYRLFLPKHINTSNNNDSVLSENLKSQIIDTIDNIFKNQ